MSDWGQTSTGLYVPLAVLPVPRPIGIDLFAGAGGFSCGFHQAGFHVAAAVEFDTSAMLTYLLNLGGLDTVIHTGPGMAVGKGKTKRTLTDWEHDRCASVFPEAGTGWISTSVHCPGPECADRPGDHQHAAPDEPAVEHFYLADVRDLTGERILADLGFQQGDVTAVFGGPPCQGFSVAGSRDVMDPRNSLVFEFARLVCEIQPKTFVMENVTGILNMHTPEGLPVIDALALVFESGGFGEYEALRRSLLASSGNGAAIKRKQRKAAPVEVDNEDQAVDEPQGALW